VTAAPVGLVSRRQNRASLASWLLAGVGLVAAITVVSVLIGPSSIPAGSALREVIDRLTPGTVDSELSTIQKSIVWDIRFPRILLGLLVGGLLASSGAAYQGVFRNPLADPYLLGIAAGAGFGATLMIVTGLGDGQGILDPVRIAAFAGALVAVALTYTVGVLGDRNRSTVSLILAGVAVASFFTALQTFVQQADSATISRVYLWILGSLTTSGWSEVGALAPYAAFTIVTLSMLSRQMDLLGVGDEEATSLGLNVRRTRLAIIVIASLATAAAVAVSGLIAFVGLIIPHTVRLLAGSSYRVIVPVSFLFGAAFLMGCDLIARNAMSPAEIPIGVVTAFFGAPFFILILRTTKMH